MYPNIYPEKHIETETLGAKKKRQRSRHKKSD